MSIVIGAMRSPRSQARMRSWCQKILVPSRISSVWSVMPLIIKFSILSAALESAQHVSVFDFAHENLERRLERFVENVLEIADKAGFLLHCHVFAKGDRHANLLIDLDDADVVLRESEAED